MTENIRPHPFRSTSCINLPKDAEASISRLRDKFAKGADIEARVFNILFSCTPIAGLYLDIQRRNRTLAMSGMDKGKVLNDCFTLATRRIWDMTSFLSSALMIDEIAENRSDLDSKRLFITSPAETLALTYQVALGRYFGNYHDIVPRGLLVEQEDGSEVVNIQGLLDYSVTNKYEALALSQDRYEHKHYMWYGMLYTPVSVPNWRGHYRLSSVKTIRWGEAPSIIYVVAGGGRENVQLPRTGYIDESGNQVEERLFTMPIDFDRINDVVAEAFTSFYPG